MKMKNSIKRQNRRYNIQNCQQQNLQNLTKPRNLCVLNMNRGWGDRFNRSFLINVVEKIRRQILRNDSLVPKIILWINITDYARELANKQTH